MKKTSFLKLVATGIASLMLSSCASNSITSSGVKPYPIDTCIVTGNKLGSMGDPVSFVHNGQEIKLCCQPCMKKFKANPEKYLAKL